MRGGRIGGTGHGVRLLQRQESYEPVHAEFIFLHARPLSSARDGGLCAAADISQSPPHLHLHLHLHLIPSKPAHKGQQRRQWLHQ